MNFGPRPFAFCALFCISSVLAVAQQTPCSSDGQTPGPGAIACVTGDGVQVTASAPVDAPQEVLPLTPEQRPAAPPIVSYQNGKLIVIAKNSTLGDVLRAIATKTGASIDVPENANERVVSQLGPAPARDVMAALLNGSHFNYVMVGTENDPNAVARVVLTAKSDSKSDSSIPMAASASPMGRPMVQPRTALQAAVMQPYQEMLAQQQAQQEAAEQQSIAPAPEPVAAASEPAPSGAASGSGSETAVEAPPAEAPRAGNGSGEKTPAQVLQDLYETRKQMMQQQRQPPPQQ